LIPTRFGQRHGRDGCAGHPLAPEFPRQLPLRPAVHARGGAAHREGLRDGGRRHLHGTPNAPRMGQCLYGGGGHHAVRSQRGQGSGQDHAQTKEYKGVHSVREWVF